MADTAVQAASWALAAEVAKALGRGSSIAEGHPGGGEYDCLVVCPEGGDGQPRLWLNREGSVSLERPGSGMTVMESSEVWDGLCCGRLGVAATARRLVDASGMQPSRDAASGVALLGWRVIAAVLNLAALYRLDWSVQSPATDTSGYATEEVDVALLAPFGAWLPEPLEELQQETSRRYWVISSNAEPVACVDIAGARLLRPGHAHQPVDVSDDGDDLSASYRLATDLIATQVTDQVSVEGAGAPFRPGLGLASVLSSFNRKERFYLASQAAGLLTGAEMHGPSLPLSAAFRHRLGAALGLEVPEHAYAATDYHLSWLHGALAWWRGEAWPGQTADWAQTTSTDGALIDGSQEDVDLLVCWTADDGSHVVGVEAKAYGAWGNAPLASKLKRLEAIRNQSGADVDVRLVLTSRQRPQKLTGVVPRWASGVDGDWAWMPLSAPGLRLRTTRCDEQGNPSATGTTWRIVGPRGH